MEKAVKPQNRRKKHQRRKQDAAAEQKQEKQAHYADSVFKEAKIHLSGSRNQGAKKST